MKKLPVGISDFKDIRSGDYYYVDKSMLIKDIINNGGSVTLYTRPRRFGKSLNMSMLKNFFEIGSISELFNGLKISEDKEFCEKYQGQYPVISLSLKEVDGEDYTGAFKKLCGIIYVESKRHTEISESDRLDKDDKEIYSKIVRMSKDAELNADSENVIAQSLKMLTIFLNKHYGKKVVILIDEYDVPLDKAHVNGYYDEMVRLLRSMFSAALKDNENLAFGVLTGCLRISKESIFTGMNNFKVNSITMENRNETFGFTESEVDAILAHYELSSKKPEVKEWYDGYKFGESEIYSPWDVVNYCQDISSGAKTRAESYWSNSSENTLVREFVNIASEKTKSELENLVNGEKIRKKIREELTYRDIDNTIENLWSVLYLTGYLTGYKDNDDMFVLWIPNSEVRKIYADDIETWFTNRVKSDTESGKKFYDAALSGNPDEMTRILNLLLRKSVSIRDSFTKQSIREYFYHGFILGLLNEFDSIESNAENGDGYSDITITDDNDGKVVILELKYSDSGEMDDMIMSCDEALEQIEKKHYDEDFLFAGTYSKIMKYGISFNKKRALVKICEP